MMKWFIAFPPVVTTLIMGLVIFFGIQFIPMDPFWSFILIFWVQLPLLVFIPLLLTTAKPSSLRMKIFCQLFRNRLAIELVDFQNEKYYTIAKKMPNGTLTAPVYYWAGVGNVTLNDDGTIDKKSESSYIDFWLPLNTSQRTLHLLKYGEPVRKVED